MADAFPMLVTCAEAQWRDLSESERAMLLGHGNETVLYARGPASCLRVEDAFLQ